MDSIKFYEIEPAFITYLSAYAPHLFQNKRAGQKNERKYIGIVFQINGFDYFAPLSSFKDKHKLMKEGLDFIKVKDGTPRLSLNAVTTLFCLKRRAKTI